MKNVHTLLCHVGLLNLLGTEEVCQALDLWYSGILSHEDTLDRLGGHLGPALNDAEHRMILGYLYHTLCA